MIKYFRSDIKKGKFTTNNEHFRDSISRLPDGGYLFCLMSLENRTCREWQMYYFATLGAWANDKGYSKDEIHHIVKDELFPELFEGVESTSELDEEDWQIVFFHLENFLILKFENR